MIDVWYTCEFLRKYDKLDTRLKIEVQKRIEEFKDRKNHQRLEVHKLTGRMKGKLGFSVDFRNRVVFRYDPKNKNTAYLMSVGDHSIYK